MVFSYARSQKKLEKLARSRAGMPRQAHQREAARDATVILLAVHWSRMNDVLKQAGSFAGNLADQSFAL